ncbi:Gfo/Idh/MocA family protein [Falsibacillus albus]|uniref:Gfo/Idh/MocA family oxidoreductase n=1 Tax=Falsibacillus albus TaxID=2478915 RepID=A0A3L7K0L0_9BACI|nr:Gfo/Idh/MocA family oxidoreductase [Falsibacillus albus]RLQ96607.1 gfo/Idh/MocA family oxidoreductase [Falsibacillus albus]
MSLRIGIVGTGSTIGVATDHLQGIRACPNWELTAVYDVIAENAEKWVKRNDLSPTIICSSLEELLEKVDAVSICTDNFSHGAIARKAFAVKLPVLCEKPLSVNYPESMKLAQEAEEAGVANYMGMQYRYHPYAQLIKELIDEGKLGQIFSYRHKLGGGRIGNPNLQLEWRMKKETSGPGSVADFGIHQIDLIQFFLGENCGKIKSVQAELGTYIPERGNGNDLGAVTNDDLSVIIARMENGAMISLNNSRLLPQDGDGLEIVGTKGAVYMNQNGEIFFRGKDEHGNWLGASEEVKPKGKHQFIGAARGKQYQEFYEIITENKDYELSFAYAANAAKIIDAAVESSEQGKRIILK